MEPSHHAHRQTQFPPAFAIRQVERDINGDLKMLEPKQLRVESPSKLPATKKSQMIHYQELAKSKYVRKLDEVGKYMRMIKAEFGTQYYSVPPPAIKKKTFDKVNYVPMSPFYPSAKEPESPTRSISHSERFSIRNRSPSPTKSNQTSRASSPTRSRPASPSRPESRASSKSFRAKTPVKSAGKKSLYDTNTGRCLVPQPPQQEKPFVPRYTILDVKKPFELTDVQGDPPYSATKYALTMEVVDSSSAQRRLFRREMERSYTQLMKESEGIIFNYEDNEQVREKKWTYNVKND